MAEGRNLLLITLDTTRADHLSCLGGEPGNTPQIDRLADRSALFTFATSETNVTNPSHLSIMTGLPAIEHRVISNTVLVPQRVDTLAEGMQRAGYETAAFLAVNHLASAGWRGFDTLPDVDGILDGADVTKRALNWLQGRDGGRPFFAWVHFFDSHILYTPPAELARRFYPGDPRAGAGARITEHEYFASGRSPALVKWLQGVRDTAYPRALYAATLNHVDTQVGRLLEALDHAQLTDETVVVLTADHGETLDEHDLFYTHGGLYEEDLRIPLIIHLPGVGARRCDSFVSTIDIVPTLEEAMGFRLERDFGGLSLLSEILPAGAMEAQAGVAERDVFVHQQAHNHSAAARQGDWKLWWPISGDESLPVTEPQLFNLREDPGETRNLFRDEPERAAVLERQLRPWIELKGVEKGSLMKRTKAQRQQLRELGYAGGEGDD